MDQYYPGAIRRRRGSGASAGDAASRSSSRRRTSSSPSTPRCSSACRTSTAASHWRRSREIGDAPRLHSALWLSTQLAVATMVIVMLLMVPTMIYVHLRMPRFRRVMEVITILPIVIPPIVLIVGVDGVGAAVAEVLAVAARGGLRGPRDALRLPFARRRPRRVGPEDVGRSGTFARLRVGLDHLAGPRPQPAQRSLVGVGAHARAGLRGVHHRQPGRVDRRSPCGSISRRRRIRASTPSWR